MKFIPTERLFTYVSLLYVMLLCQSCATSRWSESAHDAEQMMADIRYLAHDKLEGRTFGSKGEKLASAYIAKRFDVLGLQPKGENGTWYQTFTVKSNNPHEMELGKEGEKESLTGRNVIAYLDQGAPYTVVIGAHYDHLGYGHFGSLHTGEPEIHNGADDNASGVAILLELAQRLQKYRENNYLFIAFSGEENGLWGSNYYCDHPTIDLSTVNAMINYDMVGRLTDNKMALNGVGTSPAWPALIHDANVFGLQITLGESGIGPSDHTSFYLEDIPVIHMFTGGHEDYHKPSDDPEKINMDGMMIIADMSTRLVRSIGNAGRAEMEFSKTKDPDPATTPKMEVSLGVLPDYLYDGVGMRIDGVREERPAARAGLEKGDIIIRIGDKEIRDIYVYMEALAMYKKGDRTQVTVLRGETEKTFEVQF